MPAGVSHGLETEAMESGGTNSVQRVQVIEVGEPAKIQGQVLKIAVIRILLNEDDILGVDCIENAIGYGGFARSGAAANADDQTY